MICEGGTVSFADWSYNGVADAWKWIFPGGYPAISNQQNPTVIYYAEGEYDVTFIAINTAGEDTLIKIATVKVFADTQGTDLPYSEGFESASFDPLWMFENSDGNAWEVTDSASSTGSYCMRIKNFSGNARFSSDEIITQSFDLTQISGVIPRLTFDLAYAGKREITGVPFIVENDTSDLYDTFQVLVSTDCGETWMNRYAKTDSALATSGVSETEFVPTASDQWRETNVSLSGLTSLNNVRIKFRFLSDGGNNLYIDNINIATNLTIEDAYFEDFDFSVIPNPVNDNARIIFDLPKSYNTRIELTDLLGRTINTICNESLDGGKYSYKLDQMENYNQGLYFVNIFLDGMKYTKKVIIN
jgi:PKD repeat protein